MVSKVLSKNSLNDMHNIKICSQVDEKWPLNERRITISVDGIEKQIPALVKLNQTIFTDVFILKKPLIL